jgi:hypothetical protein
VSVSDAIRFIEPWHALDDSHAAESDALVAELRQELTPLHPLFGQPFTAIARRQDCDDVLFRVGVAPHRYAVVHLTWTAKPERAPEFPWTEIFNSLDEFVARMKQDPFDFG